MEKIINDLAICIEAINNGDNEDAIQMLKDIQEDLIVKALFSEGLDG